MAHWQAYRPNNDCPWNEPRVVHLHSRAAFGATTEEIELDKAAGPDEAVARLLDPVTKEPDPLTVQLTEQAVATESLAGLQAAWINEMWHGADPLGEQLTLMWHNHFATSNLKVQSIAAMHQHLATLRKHARAPFGELLHAIVKDRAMLIWLDGDHNHKDHPNENLARELMELFTIGEGHYSEQDVREAARALTGWTVKDGEVRFDASKHDHSIKRILGVEERFDASSLVELLLQRPETAERLAWRICDHFLGPRAATQQELRALADTLCSNQLNIGAAISTLLFSQLFFSERSLGHRYAPPVSFVVSNLRRLGFIAPAAEYSVPPGVAAIWMRTLGQDLLQPAGVDGWPGGAAWLGTGAAIDRARFAMQLAEGRLFAVQHRGASRMELAQQLASVDAQFD